MKRSKPTHVRATLAALFVAFIVAVPYVSAYTYQDECTGTEKIRLYENGASDHSDGDDLLQLCWKDYVNLTDISHELPGNCARGLGFGNTTWNDCVSSVEVYNLSPGQHVCFYKGDLVNRGSLIIDIDSTEDNTRWTFGGTNNDALTGIDVRASGACT